MLGETWEDQYRRMKRSYALVKSAADQKDPALDALYHFCCDVLHLRDWINKSDLIDESARRHVWTLFSDSKHKGTSWAIRVCADVANAAKHFELKERPEPPAEVVEHRKGSGFPLTFPVSFGASHFVIGIDSDKHSATEIADRAVDEWNDWLTSWNLAIPV